VNNYKKSLYLNQNILNFAFILLKKDYKKEFLVFIVLALIIFFITFFILLFESLKYQELQKIESGFDITISNQDSGYWSKTPTSWYDTISSIEGISLIYPIIKGEYYLRASQTKIEVLGFDPFLQTNLSKDLFLVLPFDKWFEDSMMITTKRVKQILQSLYYIEDFNFFTKSKKKINLKIANKTISSILLNNENTIITTNEIVKSIFDYDDEEVSLYAINVKNPLELSTIIQKLEFLFPFSIITNKEDLKRDIFVKYSYYNQFFLIVLSSSLLAFLVLLYTKGSVISNEDKKEILLLRAVGWRINQIVMIKLVQSSYIGILAFIFGFLLALFILHSSFIENLSVLIFDKTINILYIDFYLISIVFLLTIPFYIGANIFPAWKIATQETTGILR